MSGVDFFDTNILVYSLDSSYPDKQKVAQGILERALSQHSAIVSFQVVQETLQTVTRKFRVALQPVDLRALLSEVLVPLWKVHPSEALYVKALAVQAEQRFAFYDSLVVAAALQAGCKRLLTEDLQHGQRIEGLRIENPFRTG